jgi:hypothetical protein
MLKELQQFVRFAEIFAELLVGGFGGSQPRAALSRIAKAEG